MLVEIAQSIGLHIRVVEVSMHEQVYVPTVGEPSAKGGLRAAAELAKVNAWACLVQDGEGLME